MEACGDLAQTGHAYSVAGLDSANVVLIVFALQPHFEFGNFFRRLFYHCVVYVLFVAQGSVHLFDVEEELK